MTGVRSCLCAILSAAGLLGTGCDQLGTIIGLLPSAQTKVELVNNGSFPVDAKLYISDEQDIPESLLTSDVGTMLEFTIGEGMTTTFSRDCDELQAIIISDADLLIIGEVGPETSTGVLRDGDDFSCGDTIVFTFDHSEVIVDFDVTHSVRAASSARE